MASRFIIPTVDVGPGVKPASGAKMSFFATGTSTPKDTFTTAAGDIANANPVIADSNGVFPDIFIGGTYKVILTDKNDVQTGFGEKDPIEETVDSGFIDRLNPATLAVAIADTTLQDGDILNVQERSTDNGGGAEWKVVLKSTVTISPGAPVIGNIVASTGDLTLALVYRLGAWIEPRELGAIADGEVTNTDNTLAVQAALDLGKVRFDGKYAVQAVSATNYFTFLPNATLVYIGTSVETCLSINTNFGDAFVNGNLKDVRGVSVDSSGVNGDFIFVKNITASATSGTSIYPVRFNAANAVIDRVETFNTVNTGQANGSFPQAIGIVGASSHVRIGEAYCRDGQSGLVVGNNRCFVDRLHCRNMNDNGVYNLGGDLDLGDYIYEGTEEAFVCSGGRNFVRSITTIGPCSTALAIQVNDDTYVGEIIIKDDGAGSKTVTKVIAARNGAADIGRIHIGSIRGHIKGNGVLNLVNGIASPEYLQIDNIDVLLDFDAGFAGGWDIGGWFDVSSVEQCDIKNVTIRIRDVFDTITSLTVFVAKLPAAPIRDSIVENFDMYFESADGTPHPFMIGRAGPPSEFFAIKGQVFETNGLFREATFKSGQRDSIVSIPTGGFWKTGTVLYHNDTSGFDWGFYCNAGGTPGSWITLTGQT